MAKAALAPIPVCGMKNDVELAWATDMNDGTANVSPAWREDQTGR